LEQLRNEPHPFVHGVRVLELDLVHRALQALEVLAPAQRHAAVDGNHLVDAVAEDEAAVERRDRDTLERHELAAEARAAGVGHQLAVEVRDAGVGHQRKRSLRVSQPRERNPATGTSSSATTGNSATVERSRVSFIIPAFSPAASGATKGWRVSSAAASPSKRS